MNFENLENVVFYIAVFAPGFLILFGRSRFITGRMPSFGNSIFEFLMVSTVYYAFIYLVLLIPLDFGSYGPFLMLFVAPLLIGFAFGIASQKNVFRSILRKLRLNPAHHMPTSWDFVFADRKGLAWVVVKLKSGEYYYGRFGPNSFASSDLNRRDLFIESITDKNFQNIESDGRNRGVWISESEIVSVELVL